MPRCALAPDEAAALLLVNTGTPDEIVEVFRSFWRSACEERGFVLHAVGIQSQIVWLGRAWALVVPAVQQAAALAHLEQYERENPPRRRPLAPEALHRGAWLGSVTYAAVILLVGYLAGGLALDADWFDAGALVAGPTRSGEPWRAMTALTLHLDVGHLLANLGFGTVFGLLAGQLLGPGVAWASVLAAAASANLLNAFIQPASHASVGASTAVFATLGLLAAYSWRRRRDASDRWAYRLGAADRGRDPARLHRRRRRAHRRAGAPHGLRDGIARRRRARRVAGAARYGRASRGRTVGGRPAGHVVDARPGGGLALRSRTNRRAPVTSYGPGITSARVDRDQVVSSGMTETMILPRARPVSR